MPDSRRLLGPAVLAGVVGTGSCALAGGKPWASPVDRAGSVLAESTGGHVPLAAALGLAGLACWGVLLVTRGRVRRWMAALGAVVAVALVATAVVGRTSALDSARHATVNVGGSAIDTHTTAWWWIALVGAVLSLAASSLAVRHVPAWPEMGSRYDAPAGGPEVADPARMEDVDLWRAIDQGRDPTDPADD